MLVTFSISASHLSTSSFYEWLIQDVPQPELACRTFPSIPAFLRPVLRRLPGRPAGGAQSTARRQEIAEPRRGDKSVDIQPHSSQPQRALAKLCPAVGAFENLA